MAIYLLFIQHIIFSLSAKGRAAVVVPTGFLTAQSGIQKKIREKLVEEENAARRGFDAEQYICDDRNERFDSVY